VTQFHLRAEVELTEAAEWYDEQRPGLGDRFLDEVEEVLDLLAEHPRVGPELDPRPGTDPLRQFSLKSFPYVVVYSAEPELAILAVAHMSRLPGYWADRLPQGAEPAESEQSP
jgi:toxin ParE1/3/4